MVYAEPPGRADDDDCPRASGRSSGFAVVPLRDALRAPRVLAREGPNDRKGWIERRLQELSEIFAVSVAGFSVMDNHLHVLVRLDPDVAGGWSDEDVGRRSRLFLHRHLHTDRHTM
jgi:hypothetical protein